MYKDDLLKGKRILVTGGGSGLGKEMSRYFLKYGAEVLICGRRVSVLEETADELMKENDGSVKCYGLDIRGAQDVDETIADIFAEGPIDGLVNNAAVMNTPQRKTKDGFELQFGVNFLGHFLLTELLLPKLKKAKGSRIVHTSSVLHERGSIDLGDLNFEKKKYSGWDAYNQSKLAQVLYSRYQAKLLKSSKITSVSIHPGWVQTPLIKHTLPVFFQDVLLKPFLAIAGMTNTTIGSQTTLHCLVDDSVDKNSGCFYSQVGVYKDKENRKGGWPMKSPNSQVL